MMSIWRRGMGAAVLAVAVLAPWRPATAQVSRVIVEDDSVRRAMVRVGITKEGEDFEGRFSFGDLTIAAGDTVRGDLVVVGGDAEISGIVTGDVAVLWGDLRVLEGGRIVGDAGAVQGRVILEGGTVTGRIESEHTTKARVRIRPFTRRAPPSVGRQLALVGGWALMLVVLGLLTTILAPRRLAAAARRIEEDFPRAFFAGFLAQLGFTPVLLTAIFACIVTLIGILLVPFVAGTLVLLFAGAVLLGWFAMAVVAGRALGATTTDGRSRRELLDAMLRGLLLLVTPWAIAAALSPWAHGLEDFVAGVTTWAALTVGLGAALLSWRRGRRRDDGATPAAGGGGWQTPTPISGVATTRRPMPPRPGAEPE